MIKWKVHSKNKVKATIGIEAKGKAIQKAKQMEAKKI